MIVILFRKIFYGNCTSPQKKPNNIIELVSFLYFLYTVRGKRNSLYGNSLDIGMMRNIIVFVTTLVAITSTPVFVTSFTAPRINSVKLNNNNNIRSHESCLSKGIIGNKNNNNNKRESLLYNSVVGHETKVGRRNDIFFFGGGGGGCISIVCVCVFFDTFDSHWMAMAHHFIV